jgi:predicted RNase H-like HicB family nuclease
MDGRTLIEGEPDFEKLYNSMALLCSCITDNPGLWDKYDGAVRQVEDFLAKTRSFTEMDAKISYYMKLPYTVSLRGGIEQDDDVVARISEMPEVIGRGATTNEALEDVRRVQRAYLADYLKNGDKPPVPKMKGIKAA